MFSSLDHYSMAFPDFPSALAVSSGGGFSGVEMLGAQYSFPSFSGHACLRHLPPGRTPRLPGLTVREPRQSLVSMWRKSCQERFDLCEFAEMQSQEYWPRWEGNVCGRNNVWKQQLEVVGWQNVYISHDIPALTSTVWWLGMWTLGSTLNPDSSTN